MLLTNIYIPQRINSVCWVVVVEGEGAYICVVVLQKVHWHMFQGSHLIGFIHNLDTHGDTELSVSRCVSSGCSQCSAGAFRLDAA